MQTKQPIRYYQKQEKFIGMYIPRCYVKLQVFVEILEKSDIIIKIIMTSFNLWVWLCTVEL